MTSIETKKTYTSAEKAELIRQYADDMKAERIEVIDVRSKTPMADLFVICSATSSTHASAVAERVADRLRDLGIKPSRKPETANAEGWILFDYGDVFFHVMQEEKRQYYDLESLWESIEADPNLVD